MAKTNWQYGEIVTEEDFSQLGQEVNEATAGLAVLEEQLGEAEQSSKAYTDQQIQLVTATGIPKLVTYSYVLAADQQGQIDFEIPLETFVKETDTVTVAQNSTVLSTERYSVVDPKIVRLAEGVNIGTEIFVQVWKNVAIGPEGAISAAVLANDTVTESKMADEMKKDIPGGVAGYDAFAMHLADFTQQIPYAMTAGSANAYTASTTPALSALVAGVAITVKFHAANTGVATLNWNGKGAKAIKKANGSDVSPGNLKLNGVYTLRYDGASFILQGEGGEYGTATASEVLSGYTFGTETGIVNGTLALSGDAVAANVLSGKTFYNTNAKSKVTGTMSNNPSQTATLKITDSAKPTKSIPAGYVPASTITAQLDPALASKILAGNTIGGVAGTAWGVTTITAGENVKIINTSPQEIYCGGTTPVARSPQFKPKYPGTIRIKFKFNGGSYGQGTYARVYKNGIAVGTLRSVIGNPNYFIYTEDFSCVAGDVFQVYAWGNGVCEGGYMTILDIGVYAQDQFPSYFE